MKLTQIPNMFDQHRFPPLCFGGIFPIPKKVPFWCFACVAVRSLSSDEGICIEFDDVVNTLDLDEGGSKVWKNGVTSYKSEVDVPKCVLKLGIVAHCYLHFCVIIYGCMVHTYLRAFMPFHHVLQIQIAVDGLWYWGRSMSNSSRWRVWILIRFTRWTVFMRSPSSEHLNPFKQINCTIRFFLLCSPLSLSPILVQVVFYRVPPRLFQLAVQVIQCLKCQLRWFHWGGFEIV